MNLTLNYKSMLDTTKKSFFFFLISFCIPFVFNLSLKRCCIVAPTKYLLDAYGYKKK